MSFLRTTTTTTTATWSATVIVVAIVAVVVGSGSSLKSSIVIFLGHSLRYIEHLDPAVIGMSPIFVVPVDSSSYDDEREEDKYTNGWGYTLQELRTTGCRQVRGQTAVVTGANSGIGYEIAKELAHCGVDVTLVCRSVLKCDAAVEQIRKDVREIYHTSKNNTTDDTSEDTSSPPPSPSLTTMIMDMSSLESVRDACRAFVATMTSTITTAEGEKKEQAVTIDDSVQQHVPSSLKPIDMLFLNAGRATIQKKPEGYTKNQLVLSKDGYEVIFATNVLGHHLMWKYLQPFVEQSTSGGRVVLTSSAASFKKCVLPWLVPTSLGQLNDPTIDQSRLFSSPYGTSKLAQILWAKKVTRDYQNDDDSKKNVFVNAAHPGAVATQIFYKQGIGSWVVWIYELVQDKLLWSSLEGALTELYLGVAVDQLKSKNIRGKYFHPQSVEVVNPLALDENLQDDMWAFCDELVSPFFVQ